MLKLYCMIRSPCKTNSGESNRGPDPLSCPISIAIDSIPMV